MKICSNTESGEKIEHLAKEKMVFSDFDMQQEKNGSVKGIKLGCSTRVTSKPSRVNL